ncbi:hypothetical protein HU200_005874 [Digitaria exilis]|uniref:Uncharacterized protein n=1 Tax=Digitaria exilis TaxID=1010633 RepID=A0A835FQV7_9POAL|nr:hypothetical protein HU200_005874 [Digitaria exilis]
MVDKRRSPRLHWPLVSVVAMFSCFRHATIVPKRGSLAVAEGYDQIRNSESTKLFWPLNTTPLPSHVFAEAGRLPPWSTKTPWPTQSSSSYLPGPGLARCPGSTTRHRLASDGGASSPAAPSTPSTADARPLVAVSYYNHGVFLCPRFEPSLSTAGVDARHFSLEFIPVDDGTRYRRIKDSRGSLLLIALHSCKIGPRDLIVYEPLTRRLEVIPPPKLNLPFIKISRRPSATPTWLSIFDERTKEARRRRRFLDVDLVAVGALVGFVARTMT